MLDLQARIAARAFAVSVQIEQGETVAVFGPNGSGKSTLLSVLAGLLKPDAGTASLDGRRLFNLADNSVPTWLPPHSRGISLLAQEPLLFPHLSVLDNVAFGPRSAGVSRTKAHTTAAHWLTEVDALHLAARKPDELSGGQAQRIAVARALASDPTLLLLDEPMAALDISVAPAMRRMLRRVLADRTAIIVTHDILDAYTLADRVLILDHGTIVEHGPTSDVFERPRTAFTARLAALNVLTGTRTETGLRLGDGTELTAPPPMLPIPPGHVVSLAIRPSAVSVTVDPPHRPDGLAGNLVLGKIRHLELRGDLVRVRSEHIAADVAPKDVATLDLGTGSNAWFSFAPADAVLYSSEPIEGDRK